jgi:hypothetical protein
MISPSFIFFPLRFDPHFFYIGKFLKLIFFSISSFNIKLVGNWASWLSPSLEFHGLWVWKTNLDLRDSLRFHYSPPFFQARAFFFFFQFHHFRVYLIGDGTLLFFYLLSIWCFTNFKNDMDFLGSFCLLFFVKFSFFLKK